MAEIESLLIRLEADASLMRRELQRAAQGVDRFAGRGARSLTRFERSMKSAQRAAVGFAAAIGASMVAAFGAQAVRDAIAYGAALEHTAQRLGFTAERMQELRFAASDFGIEARQVDMGLQRFTRRLSQAAQEGRGELLPVLQDMGIAFRNQDGTTRDAMAVLLDFADAMQELDNQGDRVLAGFKAFDSEGVALINVLQQGRAGIEAYIAQARELGIVLSNEGAAAAAELDRRIDILSQRMRAQFTDQVIESADALETFAEMVGEGVSNLIEFVDWLHKVGKAARAMIDDINEAANDIEMRTPERALSFADDLITELDAGTLGVIEARERLEREMGFMGQQLADQLELPERQRTRFGPGVMGVSMADITPGEMMDPASEAAATLRSEIEAMIPLWEEWGNGTDLVRQRLEEQARAAEEAANAEEDRATNAIEDLALEDKEAGKLVSTYQRLAEARQQADADAQALAEGALTAAEVFQRNLDRLVELQDSKALEEASLALGLDVDTVVLRTATQLVRDLKEEAGDAGVSAEFLRTQLAALGLPPDVVEHLANMSVDIDEAAEAASRLADQFAKSVGGSIEDAIMKTRDLKELLGDIANEIARLLIRRNIVNPIVDFLSAGVEGLIQGPGGGTSTDTAGMGGAPPKGAAGAVSAPAIAPVLAKPVEAPAAPSFADMMAAAQMTAATQPAPQGAPINVSISNVINADNADAEGLARVEERIDQLERSTPEAIVGALRERDRRMTGAEI